MTKIRGVILDVDGTLVDSNDAHAHAWAEAMSEQGFHPEFSEVRRRIGMGGDYLVKETLNIDPDGEPGSSIKKRRKEIFTSRYMPSLKPFPRTRDLLEKMRESGLKLVAASASKEDVVKELLKKTGVVHLLEDFTSDSDVENSKPEPDVVQAALKKLGMNPDEVIMIGDTPYDLEAGARAGIKVIAFRSGGWSDDDLSGAAAVYQDAADLLEHFDNSPLNR